MGAPITREQQEVFDRYVQILALADPVRLLRLTDAELGQKFREILRAAAQHRDLNLYVNKIDPPEEGT